MTKHRLPEGREALTAHDVRHLKTCTSCGELADDRMTVWHMHPECYYRAYGEADVLGLPIDDQNKFSLGDIPASLMKRLLDQR